MMHFVAVRPSYATKDGPCTSCLAEHRKSPNIATYEIRTDDIDIGQNVCPTHLADAIQNEANTNDAPTNFRNLYQMTIADAGSQTAFVAAAPYEPTQAAARRRCGSCISMRSINPRWTPHWEKFAVRTPGVEGEVTTCGHHLAQAIQDESAAAGKYTPYEQFPNLYTVEEMIASDHPT